MATITIVDGAAQVWLTYAMLLLSAYAAYRGDLLPIVEAWPVPGRAHMPTCARAPAHLRMPHPRGASA